MTAQFKRLILSASTVILVCLMGVGIFWLGGYDFHTRNPDVAFGALTTLLVGFMFGNIVYMNTAK